MTNPNALFTNDELVSPAIAARLLSVGIGFLERDRMRSQPRIPFIRISARAIRYRMSDLRAYMESNTIGRSA